MRRIYFPFRALLFYTNVYIPCIYMYLLLVIVAFFFFFLPRPWIDDGRSIFDYEIEINKCASLSSVSSFLRVWKSISFFLLSFARLKLLSETFNSQRCVELYLRGRIFWLISLLARFLGFVKRRGQDSDYLFSRWLWIEINRDAISNAFLFFLVFRKWFLLKIIF